MDFGGPVENFRRPNSPVRRLLPIVLLLLGSTEDTVARGFFENLGRETGSCFSGGCDVIWAANRRIDAGISSKVESAVGPIKVAIEQIMQDLFNNNIDPMLDRINTISQERLSRIDNIVQTAIKTAREATDKTIDHVKTAIIIESAKQTEEVSKAIVGAVTCVELTTTNQVQAFIDNNLSIFGSLRDAAAG